MPRIYVSSTYEDLKEYREAVYKALSTIREAKVIAMEDYVAQDRRPLETCLEDVVSCDVYVGIFAWRYGYIPDDEGRNPKRMSITELEYRKAREKGIPCLVFLVDENAHWPPRHSDGMAQSGAKSSERVNRLREELKERHGVSFFRSPDHLATLVLDAVNPVLPKTERPPQAEPPPVVAEMPVEFVGEKKVLVGRQDYIDSIIKEKIQAPGSIVSIVGPGCSGKTQLAYKTMRKYVKEEEMFDLVVPVYFGRDIPPLPTVLSKMAEGLGIPIEDFERERDVDKRKQAITKELRSRRHPLIYLDNYETISFELNRQMYEMGFKPSEDALQTEYFFKNDVPNNVSILLTSREANNRLGENPIVLPGLKKDEGKDLFYKMARPVIGPDSFGDMEIQTAVDKVMEVTGGHPLSIELIASNIESISDLKEMTGEIQQRIGQSEIYNPDERLRSLQACFDYTVERLSEKLRSLLFNLTVFNSPFPIDAPAKILSGDDENHVYDEKDIERLYNRTLLTRIESDDLYGKLNSKYWLYAFHPATRNYLLDVRGIDPFSMEIEFDQKFYRHYYDMLYSTYYSIGKETHTGHLLQGLT